MIYEHDSITASGTTWCPDCKRSKKFLGDQRMIRQYFESIGEE